MTRLPNEYDPQKPTMFGHDIKVDMDWEAQRLQFNTTIKGFTDQLVHESICFKDKAVRTALIALGWTPPPEE